MGRFIHSVLLLAPLLVISITAQENPSPGAHIDGTVIDGLTEKPLPSVIVQVGSLKVTTNREGRFALDDVATGKQLLVAERDGYLRARLDTRKTSGGAGIPLTLTAGQSLRNLTLYIVPAGAVSGRIVDAQGRPVINANVFTFRSMFDELGGKSFFAAVSNSLLVDRDCQLRAGTPMISATATGVRTKGGVTDDRGEFRIYNLEPGRYGFCIRAAPGVFFIYPSASDWNSATLVNIEIGTDLRLNSAPLPREIMPGNPGGGGARRPRGTAEAPGDAPAPSEGLLRGRAVIETAGVALAAGVELGLTHERLPGLMRLSSQPDESFPWGPMPLGLIRLRSIRGVPAGLCLRAVRQGERDALENGILVEQSGADFTVVLGDSEAEVRGTAQDSAGVRAPGAHVVLVPDNRERFGFYSSTVADQDGAFQIPCVAPGAYHVYVWFELDGEAYRDPEFLKKYEGQGRPVQIEKGGRSNVTVIGN